MKSTYWKSRLINGEPVTVVAYGDSWTYDSVAEDGMRREMQE